MKKDNNEKCAKIIKNLNALGHLITNIKFNYGILCSVYEHKDEIEDIEFKDIEKIIEVNKIKRLVREQNQEINDTDENTLTR